MACPQGVDSKLWRSLRHSVGRAIADFGERAVEDLVAARGHAENDNFRGRI